MNVGVNELRDTVRNVLVRCGISPRDQEWIVEGLITADLRGVSTHGVVRLEAYVGGWMSKALNPQPQVEVVSEGKGAVRVIDGDRGLGLVVGRVAMDEAMRLASVFGVGLVTARNSNHAGMLAQYVLPAADAGMLGYFVSNGPPLLPAWGGRDPVLFNNPFSYAVPAGDNPAIVLDMACSTVARGAIRLAAKEDRPIPEGWALDSDGRPTRDAHAAMDGVLLPMSEHKGSAIAVINECLATLLSGATFSAQISSAFLNENSGAMDHWGAGHFVMAIDLAAFSSLATITDRASELIAMIKSGRTADTFDEILYPGEREARLTAERLREGIPLGEEAGRSLRRVCERTGVTCPL